MKGGKSMAAELETMFYVREKPWHGLGTRVEAAPNSKEALKMAGLDWKVTQEPVFTGSGKKADCYLANVRSTDHQILGIVSDKYRVIQNDEAFEFTDSLLGQGVRYETAGSLFGGRRVWILARLPREYIIAGEKISPYLVFSNSHDGSGAIRVAVTPIRVVCNNTLNLALHNARRSWSMIHKGDIKGKIQEAREALFHADDYMLQLSREFERLNKTQVSDRQVSEYIDRLIPMDEKPTPIQKKNVLKLREGIKERYYNAPDLKSLKGTAYRLINAVSDFATHGEPLRKTANYRENLFARTVDGHPMIDRAYQMLQAAA